jgi:hypothetical protein
MSNITGNKRNVDDTLNANKKSKTLLPPPPPASVLPPPPANVLPPPPASVLPENRVKFDETITTKNAPTYITEYTMNFKKPGEEYNYPKHINGESPSGSEYQLESSGKEKLKPMSPEKILEPLASEYRGIYLLAIGNNTIPIVDNKGQSYALLYEPNEMVKNIYEDAIDGLNNNELHIQSQNGLRRIAIDMVKDKVIKDSEGNVKEIKKQIYYGRAPFSSNRVFKKFNNNNKLITYRKIIQQNGSNYFYVVIELNNTISGGFRTFGSDRRERSSLKGNFVSLKKRSKKRLITKISRETKFPLKTIKNKK